MGAQIPPRRARPTEGAGRGPRSGLAVALFVVLAMCSAGERACVRDCEGEETPAPPAVAKVLKDINGDGEKTVCVVGDSISNGDSFYNELRARLVEPDNILRCAAGGRRTGDVARSWLSILDGHGDRNIGCSVARGKVAKCDYAVLHIGVNGSDATGQRTQRGFCMQRGCVGGPTPGIACKASADCGTGGVCTNKRGPQQGGACQISSGTSSVGGGSWLTNYYCDNGDHIGECCAGTFCTAQCGWTGLTMCESGLPNLVGNLCSSPSDCGGGACSEPQVHGRMDFLDDVRGPGWCVESDPASPECPKGVCIHQTTPAYYAKTMTAMLDQAAARTGSSKVTVILLGNTDTIVNVAKNCIGGTNHKGVCATNADCPPASPTSGYGVCDYTGVDGTWHSRLGMVRWYNEFLYLLAQRRAIPYFDLGGYMRRLAGGNPDENLRDGVHPSDLGEQRAADGVAACLTEDPTVPENDCGDL